MFSCVWLHFKKCFEKYFLMFGCVLQNTIENTFFTCCSHFLTFSRLLNEYIISFIPQNTNKTQKKIIKSGHFARLWSRSKLHVIAIGASRDRLGAGDLGGRFRWTISADDLGNLGDWSFGRSWRARLWTISTLSSFFLPLSLSLALSLFLFCAWPGNGLKVKWKCKTISGSKE